MGYLDTFRDHADAFDAVVGAAPADRWDAQSPCTEWTAADVVAHVVDSQRDFLARQDLDAGERAAGSPAEMWRLHRAAVDDLLAGGVGDRSFAGFFGPTTIGDTLANFYGFDLIVHRWDLARALDVPCLFTDAEMDQIEVSLARFGDHVRDAGVCGPAVAVGADASRQDRLLGVLGRDPRG